MTKSTPKCALHLSQIICYHRNMSIEDILTSLDSLKNESNLEKKTRKKKANADQMAARAVMKDAREREAFRKLDTRIKIFIGGYFLSKLEGDELHKLLDVIHSDLDSYNQNALKKWRRIMKEKREIKND